MGFRQAKKDVIECLTEGRIRHEQRNDIDIKNLLAIGAISAEEVAALINKARGTDYNSSQHHFDKSIQVHIVQVRHQGKSWYIKWYLLEPNSWFISVHN